MSFGIPRIARQIPSNRWKEAPDESTRLASCLEGDGMCTKFVDLPCIIGQDSTAVCQFSELIENRPCIQGQY